MAAPFVGDVKNVPFYSRKGGYDEEFQRGQGQFPEEPVSTRDRDFLRGEGFICSDLTFKSWSIKKLIHTFPLIGAVRVALLIAPIVTRIFFHSK